MEDQEKEKILNDGKGKQSKFGTGPTFLTIPHKNSLLSKIRVYVNRKKTGRRTVQSVYVPKIENLTKKGQSFDYYEDAVDYLLRQGNKAIKKISNSK